jgi:hypothetical protein
MFVRVRFAKARLSPELMLPARERSVKGSPAEKQIVRTAGFGQSWHDGAALKLAGCVK